MCVTSPQDLFVYRILTMIEHWFPSQGSRTPSSNKEKGN
jgi:hypothetical protein